MSTMTIVIIFCLSHNNIITSYGLKGIFEHSRESYRFFVSFLKLRKYEALWLHFCFSWKHRDSLQNRRRFAQKKFGKKQYDGFPHFFSDVACFQATQDILQASGFALWIDCPAIGLVINDCQITIYVPGGFLQFWFLGLLWLPMSFACSGKTL